MKDSYLYYIPTQKPQQIQGGAGKYHGQVALGYDKKRDKDPKWFLEQAIIEEMLSSLKIGSTVLDCPVGTGRFLKFYHDKGYNAVGVDMSTDMLQVAQAKTIDHNRVKLIHGDVRALPVGDKSVDAAVMCRLTRWLSPKDCQIALGELQRVAREKIVFTARIANHKEARTLELFEAALDGWKIHRQEVGVDMDYYVIELRPS